VVQCGAVLCSVLQCVAGVLQCVAVCYTLRMQLVGCLRCSVLQGVARCCNVLQDVAGCCMVLQGVAWCCRLLQGVTVFCRVLWSDACVEFGCIE